VNPSDSQGSGSAAQSPRRRVLVTIHFHRAISNGLSRDATIRGNVIGADLFLKDARIVLPDRIVDRGGVVLVDGRIDRIFDTSAHRAQGPHTLELHGATLFPGFIDLHIHGAVGVDTMEASTEGLQQVSEFLTSQGVTGWLPTLVPASLDQYTRSIDTIAERMRSQHDDTSPGARALGVHYEGPFVNSKQCGALHREHFRTFQSAADLDCLAVLPDREAVHLMTLAPEIEGGVELVQELDRRGWIVSLGHTRAQTEVLDQAAKAGARHMTHFMNAMAPLHHRSPGPVGWGLMRDDVTCDMIADGLHLDRETLRLLQKLKTPARLLLISDAICAAGLGDGDYQIWGETISVAEGRTSNSSGTIAGSVITMLDAVRMMLSLGASEVEVARMAATNPARLVRIEKECGSIAAGKRADLVALDHELKVKLTIIGGQVAYSDN